MPEPTKSFFDQVHRRKYYRWPVGDNRSLPTNGNANTAKPPIPASFQTRTKLKAFAYTGASPACPSMLTAGSSIISKAPAVSPSTDHHIATMSSKMKENRKISLPHANTFPSTPSDRLTLDELIGDIDESKLRKPVEDSPDEILGWNPNSSNPNTTPGRKRKRAVSSSPGYPSASAEKNNGLGIQHIHKTPVADPSTTLWQRYGEQKDGVKLPDISFAMQATPRPVETPLKSAGLRRWASAGNEWPGRSKRQKVGATKVWRDKPHDQSKMVAILDKIQESLAGQQLERRNRKEEPSSSSPLPQAAALFSPRRAKAVPLARSPARKSPLKNQVGANPRAQHDAGSPSKKATSVACLHSQSSATIELEAADLEELAMDINSDDFDDVDLDALTAAAVKQEFTIAEQSKTAATQIDAKDLEVFADDFDDANGDDEFDLADMDEQGLLEAELNATQAYNAKPRRNDTSIRPHSRTSKRIVDTSPNSSTPLQQARYQRFVVQSILDCTTIASKQQEKVLLVQDADSAASCTITLRGSWIDTNIVKDQVVHIAYAPKVSLRRHQAGNIFVDDSELSPLLVVHPDHLLSATAVADSFDCTRKAVLFDRIKATSDATIHTVYGKILHEVFQQALIANEWTEHDLRSLTISTVQAHLEGLWALGQKDQVQAIEDIQGKMTELSAWAGVYIQSTPSINAKVKLAKDESLRVAITGLVAIEEHVWSPMYGLKGNVDATVQVNQDGARVKTVLTPLELKTGRASNSPAHHAQTALYTLLMSDRYDIAVEAGILYYMQSSDISWVAPTTHVVRQMVQQRNALASAIHHASLPPKSLEPGTVQLPEMLKNTFTCGRCYAQESCFTFHALAEDGTADSAGMIDDSKRNHSATWKAAVEHLTDKLSRAQLPQAKEWFSRWDRLLTFEEGETSRSTKELWTMSSKEREAAGRCFGKLVIRIDHLALSTAADTIDGIESSGGKINRFLYTFERSLGRGGRPFNDGSQLIAGEAIVVSSEQGQWALAKGYIVSITSDSIVVGVDRRLGDARQKLDGFDAESNQAFKGIMKVSAYRQAQTEYKTLYRIDKDGFTNGLALIRSNLVKMMSSDPMPTNLREIIIHGREPAFEKGHNKLTLQPSQLGAMNEDQVAAVDKVMSAKDYALILGMPGTGKTTTIAHLIRALLADGKSILLTSYTHTAVDNILLKIRDIAPPGSILRLGVASKVNAQVQEFCHLGSAPRKSFEELDEVYLKTQIVATTCLGINHAGFSRRRCFDVCIIDEASQITMPTSLGPLLFANKFVLVGDHYQLSPLVQSRSALEGGLDMSLFRLLSEQHPGAIAELGKQYRMCEEIMTISNELIYDNRLRCGSDAVANRTIKYSDSNGLAQFHSKAACQAQQCWLIKITDPQRKVIFANTDDIGDNARECLINSGKKITNRLEAVLTAQVVLSLQAQGVAANDIGVIALYRTQITLIRQLFGAAAITSAVEFDSADRFQGRDKECIIISMVRSNEAGTVGDLIKDWRRLNVAFTRARSKLIVIGSRSTLKNNELMAKLLEMVDGRGQSFALPADAETNHGSAFEFVSQATSLISPAVLPPSPAIIKQSKRPASQMKERIALQEMSSSANRGLKKPTRTIDGRTKLSQKTRKAKEQIAIEIFEGFQDEDWTHEIDV